MRNYLFHGKRIDNGEWAEGHYYTQVYHAGTIEEEWYHFIKPIGSQSWEYFRVEPMSVSEFTGIYDINKRKIFENDIVKTQPFTDKPYSSRAKSKQHIGVVEYCTPELRGDHFKQRVYDARWRVRVNDYGKFVCSNWSDFFNCEVIGNVFENADLLEG